MGKRSFPGPRRRPASDEAGRGGAVVRRAKRPYAREYAFSVFPRDRMNERRLDALGFAQFGKDGGETLGEHGLSRAGRTDHDDPMAPRSGHLKRALGHLVAHDVDEIEAGARVGLNARGQRGEMGLTDMGKALEQKDFEPFKGDALCVKSPAHEAQALILRALLESKHPAHRAHVPTQGELPHHKRAVDERWVDLARRGEQAQRDGQIEARSAFAQRTRSEIHHDLIAWHGEPARPQRRAYAFAGFLDSRIGHADDRKRGNTVRYDHLDGDRHRLDAADGGASNREDSLSHVSHRPERIDVVAEKRTVLRDDQD